ncbi:hypothetical protein ABVV53_01395 [Novosphingobium sp. RD2P27]|uniref:PAS domain-containing protein n=1 Tax=Novosphingobium kalidii TaxID=3230299 RepID=A0ABV2CWZ0_9SPHN
MDILRADFRDTGDHRSGEGPSADDETGRELPPTPIGQDERRMQVRAYNFWASRLGERQFPSLLGLEPENLPDFAPYGVLLDFSSGIEDPAIGYIGSALAEECGTSRVMRKLSDVPGRSLLSRITDHYMQILANQAPIGFEAEFVNWRGATIAYRGILLPFSSDDETIDHIFGVINWKELADAQVAGELQLQMEQAIEPLSPLRHARAPLTDWADGPAEIEPWAAVSRLTTLPVPDFGLTSASYQDIAADIDLPDGAMDEADMALADWLASARELALNAAGCEDRSRHALYAAIGRAYDFVLAAGDDPDELRELVEDAGLTMQTRAPLTPLVKLVFGADYDKTRLAEFAAALGHAQRLGLGMGSLATHLANAPGGLKAIVAEERRLRRAETARPARESAGGKLAERLRTLDSQPMGAIAAEGNEFALLVARRLPEGGVVLLGEVADDPRLLERAARHLL